MMDGFFQAAYMRFGDMIICTGKLYQNLSPILIIRGSGFLSQHQGFFWQNKAGVHVKQQFPVTDRSGRTRLIETELRELRVGAQDPALFEVPDGYRRLDIDTAAVLGELFGF